MSQQRQVTWSRKSKKLQVIIYNRLSPVRYLPYTPPKRRHSRRYGKENLQLTGGFDLRHVLNHRRYIREQSLLQNHPTLPASPNNNETCNLLVTEGTLDALNSMMAGLQTQDDTNNASDFTGEGDSLVIPTEDGSSLEEEQRPMPKAQFLKNLRPARPLHPIIIV